MTNMNLPCPFCGGQVDPDGWLNGDGKRGPECETCGATAESLERWNTRTVHEPAGSPFRDGEVRVIYEHGEPAGVRDKGGYLCFFNRVTKWTDQEDRYRNELALRARQAEAIAAALIGAQKVSEPAAPREVIPVVNDAGVFFGMAAPSSTDGQDSTWKGPAYVRAPLKSGDEHG